jgi:hypothetical protein
MESPNKETPDYDTDPNEEPEDNEVDYMYLEALDDMEDIDRAFPED